MPKKVPDEYSRECGTPYECEVDEDIYERVRGSENGVWFLDNDYPKGGIDGWMSL